MEPTGTSSDTGRGAVWRDAAIVAAVTLGSALTFTWLEFNERVFDATRQWEHLQIDELPATLAVLALGLGWFSWRRYREARAELARRREAEVTLEKLLLDNRRLARQYLHVQESERKSLARELHDELGQYLNAIKTDAVSLNEKLSDAAPGLKRAATAIIEHADHMHAVVRDLVRRLRPVGLDELGLRAALEHYLDHCQRRMPNVQFSISLEGDLDDLGEQVSLAVYRLVQEGITNVSRHAHAKRVEVLVTRTDPENGQPPQVRFSICDDGRGAVPEAPSTGLGLVGMRERVEMLGGQLKITTGAAQGFNVSAWIPLQAEGAA
jgi:two-component system sensor histidine kinase UhpB